MAVRKARRRTIPRRRSAAPSGQGERPFGKCGIAAKPAAALPDRGSKPPAATPSERCSRDRSAAAGKDSGSYAQCCRPSQRPRRGYPFDVPTAPPLALAAPAPHPRTTAAAAAGRAFPLGRLLRPGHRAGRARTRSAAQPLPSLHDPRHRSCTGSRLPAALPALDALRHCSGRCAAAGSCQGLRGPRR